MQSLIKIPVVLATIYLRYSNRLPWRLRFLHFKKQGGIMFVRLTFIQFSKESLKEAKRLYMEEIVPIVRKQKGNINVHLLEPTSSDDDFISVTEWESEGDSLAYDSSGTYKQLVGRFTSYFTKPPILKTYAVEDVLIATH